MLGTVLAQVNPDIVGGAGEAPNTIQDIEKVFANVISVAIPAAGIVLFVFLLLAGVNLISAGDDPKKAATARSMATYAILGIVVVGLAYLVLNIIAAFTGVTSILQFQITQ